MKKKYYHRKLIRDKIPEKIKTEGGKDKIRIMTRVEYEKELKKKLIEESKELMKTPKDSLINELADILEVIKSISSHYKIPYSKVEKFQEAKRKKRGGFKKRLFLIWSSEKAGK
jgi:predicted house-cleaning noncanonical NTP pyrophosphatase (MazG superfamily)